MWLSPGMHFPLFTGVGAGIVCSHLISWCQGPTVASRRPGRSLPLLWGGGYISRAGREEGIAVVADRIVKPLLIPGYPLLSCPSGRCHVVPNNCHAPVARWPLWDGGGSMRGPLIWLLQGSSIPEMLQVLEKQSFHAAASEKGPMGSVISALHQ